MLIPSFEYKFVEVIVQDSLRNIGEHIVLLTDILDLVGVDVNLESKLSNEWCTCSLRGSIMGGGPCCLLSFQSCSSSQLQPRTPSNC